jgi:hypothetical protein
MNLPTLKNSNRLRIIVLGYFVRWPVGGMAWHYLQFVLGLARLGHDVYFVEDSDEYPSCWDPSRKVMDTDPAHGVQFTQYTFDKVGIADRWAYYDWHRSSWLGPCAQRIGDICATADLVLNVSGVNPLRPWLMDVPVRVLVDTDPGFTQIKHLTETPARELAEKHNRFLTFGENIGREDCAIPDDGFAWQPARQPVVLDAWPVTPGPPDGEIRTLMQWDSYPQREYNGKSYGMKSDSFTPFMRLPSQVGVPLALAATRLPEDTQSLLRRENWRLLNPAGPSRDAWTYQSYIQESKAEFTVAKQGYVITGCGWFSERSACFLASGRPVVAQDTRYSRWLPTGSGVLPFTTIEDAVAAIEEVGGRYDFHCRCARQIADEYFDHRKVLPSLIDRAMNPAAT